ncbi:hypothetical protein [Nocardia sp. SYP-A9097]|uniref:hypothetical protein n=1 Tax=Nocardia sp. SYP-A9097 TaxID=2663237 RepID=UPI001E572732|nr:hypothetical protein [Nocardia sp. SYP-A9097]
MTTAAQRRLAQAQQRLRERVLHEVSTLDAFAVDTILATARADMPRTVLELDAYLADRPGGLLDPDPFCPLGIVRLARTLAAAGYPVTPPACAPVRAPRAARVPAP